EIKNSNERQQMTFLSKGRIAAHRQRASDPKEEEQQLWQLYYYQRYENQLTFYASRRNEFQKAQAQATFLTITLMTSASIVSFLGSANVLSFSLGWSVLAVVFPVLAASLSNYESVYAFERHAKLYEDALVGLESIGMPLISEGASIASLQKYASLIESVLKTEQGQWGQLISEVKGAAPPGINPNVGGVGD
ncbi:MAG TPA: hypothetical protein VFU69_19460, partial [Ktedonobacterales bacterium]|nr:hypothetical protein [Ktedonobacterales bacterium]